MRAASSGSTDEQLARKIKAPEKSETTAAQPHSSRLPGSIGVVKTLNGDGTATVTYNGADIPCQLLGDFYPVVGQSVLVLIEGTRNWVIGPVSASPSGWQSIADTLGYASGWSDYDNNNALGSYRTIGDMVQIRGTVVGGTGAIFTLPVGYRPQSIEGFTGDGDGAFAAIAVGGDGVVTQIVGTATGFLNLGLISFSVN